MKQHKILKSLLQPYCLKIVVLFKKYLNWYHVVRKVSELEHFFIDGVMLNV